MRWKTSGLLCSFVFFYHCLGVDGSVRSSEGSNRNNQPLNCGVLAVARCFWTRRRRPLGVKRKIFGLVVAVMDWVGKDCVYFRFLGCM